MQERSDPPPAAAEADHRALPRITSPRIARGLPSSARPVYRVRC